MALTIPTETAAIIGAKDEELALVILAGLAVALTEYVRLLIDREKRRRGRRRTRSSDRSTRR